jgi:hypothetical protein
VRPGGERCGQPPIGTQVVQQGAAFDPEQVAHQNLDPALGEHGVDLGLAVRAKGDELGAVTDQFA